MMTKHIEKNKFPRNPIWKGGDKIWQILNPLYKK